MYLIVNVRNIIMVMCHHKITQFWMICNKKHKRQKANTSPDIIRLHHAFGKLMLCHFYPVKC